MTADEWRALGEPICDDPNDPCFGVPERFINRSHDFDSSKQRTAEDDRPSWMDDWSDDV